MNFEMNIFWALVFLIAGLSILLKGAIVLVDGAVALAKSFGISPLVIGLTIVAMGTSAPEVATSITATARNLGNIAIGNVYGSNIANLALVGGLCAVIAPITVKLSTLRKELPMMLIVAGLLWPILALDLHLGRLEGCFLLILFAALLIYTIFAALKQSKTTSAENLQTDSTVPVKKTLLKSSIFIILGLAGLAIGAYLAVEGAVFIGRRIGLSEAVIGLTIIAVGTSLPELMTCLVAAFKGHDDISVGTLVGSNIFNALLAIGCAGLIRPFEITARLVGVDYWIMVIVTAAFVIMATIGKRINRISGLILTTGYIAYILYLFVFTRNIA